MISFKNDYSKGAHPAILDALIRNNGFQEEGYGLDRHSRDFTGIIRKLVGHDDCDVHLLPGGTQTNLTVISSLLRPHEACIAADTGHISTHETGAVEATGHKVLTLPTPDGKLTPSLIEPVLKEHYFEHMVKPRLVYISNTTEVGTVYSRKELRDLYDYCSIQDLLLYADGARLGSALVVPDVDLTLKDMYELTDVFYIGGTKNGALFGEALVVRNNHMKEEFRYLIKQRGGLLAKGWIIGLQFLELFNDNLYFRLASHANEMARYLARELTRQGCSFLVDSPSNQIFPIMENPVIAELEKEYQFFPWQEVDETKTAIRLVTSWSTGKEAVDAFLNSFKRAISKS